MGSAASVAPPSRTSMPVSGVAGLGYRGGDVGHTLGLVVHVGPCELEQALREGLESGDVPGQVVDEVPALLGRHVVEVVAEHLQRAGHRGQRSLELVADAAGEVADVPGSLLKARRHRRNAGGQLGQFLGPVALDVDIDGIAGGHALGAADQTSYRSREGSCCEDRRRNYHGAQQAGGLKQQETLRFQCADDGRRRLLGDYGTDDAVVHDDGSGDDDPNRGTANERGERGSVRPGLLA